MLSEEDFPEHSPGMLSHLVDLLICFTTQLYLVLTKVLPNVYILGILIFLARSWGNKHADSGL